MRGQIISLDVVTGSFIFLAVFTVFIVMYVSIMDAHAKSLERSMLEIDGELFLQKLIKTPGYPIRWEANTATVKVLGLSERNSNVLNPNKVNAFFLMPYSGAKGNFSTSASDFHLQFNTSGRNMGSAPGAGIDNVVFLQRFAYYNNSIEKIYLRLWRDS